MWCIEADEKTNGMQPFVTKTVARKRWLYKEIVATNGGSDGESDLLKV